MTRWHTLLSNILVPWGNVTEPLNAPAVPKHGNMLMYQSKWIIFSVLTHGKSLEFVAFYLI